MTAGNQVITAQRRAVIIGINNYDDSQTHPPLQCCVRDAIGIYVILTDTRFGNFSADDVFLMLDSTGKDVRSAAESVVRWLESRFRFAARSGIVDEIVHKKLPVKRERIMAEIKRAADFSSPGDLLVVHFAGHGQVFDGEVYLIPPEARHGIYSDTAISLNKIKFWLDQSQAAHKLLLLDACYSLPPVPSTRNTRTSKALFGRSPGVAVFASCMPWEQSYEEDDASGHPLHGIFTYYLMEVLSLQADELGRGFVTLGDAHRYVKNQVNRWIMKRIVPLEGSSQTPSLRADGADHIVLSGRRIEVDPDPREPFEGGYVNLRRNPFTWRNAITRAEDFFGRSIERNQILQYLEGRQSCEVVGELRIGKTSLLLQIAREAPEYLTTRGLHPALAYIDLLDARCSKLSGWLRQLGMAFGWRNTPANLVDFANCIDEMLSTGRSPVLCLDEFERFTQQKDEFDNAFFYALRSATQKGMSIITSSQVHVSSLTNPENPTVSPLSGVLAFIPLAGFSLEEAHNFIARERGVTPFTADQTEAILRFARHRERQPGAGIHPLSLQVACFHVLEAARNGGALKSALRRADADMRNHLRSWPKMTAT